MARKPMARKATLLATALFLLVLALTGCNNSGSGGGNPYQGASEAATGTPSITDSGGCPAGGDASASSSDCQAACGTASPGSEAQASCEAAGIPGTTQNAQRCGATTPSPIAQGLIQGTFGAFCENAIAVTYDPAQVPDGAAVSLNIEETDAATTVHIQPQGFTPDTTFSGTLHDGSCGAEPADLGNEYINSQSTQVLALDFTTDADGNADTSDTVPWLVPDDGLGRSIALYAAQGGSATPPQTGGDDDLVACINLEQ